MKNRLEKIFDFLHKTGKLKSTFRFSDNQNMPKELKDSSAAHSWRLALMVSVIIDELNLKIDKAHALELALIHDIAESITGDIDQNLIFTGRVSEEEKYKGEKRAMKKIKELLPLELGSKIFALWNESEESSTREAKFVRALDKLEALIHLIEVGYKAFNMPEFIPNYADRAVQDFPELTNILRITKEKLKVEFKKGNIPWRKKYEHLC